MSRAVRTAMEEDAERLFGDIRRFDLAVSSFLETTLECAPKVRRDSFEELKVDGDFDCFIDLAKTDSNHLEAHREKAGHLVVALRRYCNVVVRRYVERRCEVAHVVVSGMDANKKAGERKDFKVRRISSLCESSDNRAEMVLRNAVSIVKCVTLCDVVSSFVSDSASREQHDW